MMKKGILISGLMFFLPCNSTLANSSYNVYITTLSILSYSQLANNKATTLCVVNNPVATSQLQHYIGELNYHYSVKTLNDNHFVSTQCEAVFFSTTPPLQQQQLLNSSEGQGILSFSTNNPECEIGSTFCLYTTTRGSTSFKVNLYNLVPSSFTITSFLLIFSNS